MVVVPVVHVNVLGVLYDLRYEPLQVSHRERSSESEENVDPYGELRRLLRVPATPWWHPIEDIETSLNDGHFGTWLFALDEIVISQDWGHTFLNSSGRCWRSRISAGLVIFNAHHTHKKYLPDAGFREKEKIKPSICHIR